MSPLRSVFPRSRRIGRAALRDDSGATLVEFAICLALFLLIFFGLLDFGRLAYSYVMAEKAMQRSARIAAVRPPACTGLPNYNERNPGYSGPLVKFGNSCNQPGGNVCAPVNASCVGDPANATASEVWESVAGLMPSGATVANIRFRYDYDPDLGFLGGPYVPVVTTELEGVSFSFISPLGGLARLAGATDAGDFGDIVYPPMSVSLPGEDLAQGNSG